jgi:hypothetical protein
VITPRAIADRIADFLFRITSEYGRPIVLTVEDREALADLLQAADDFVDSPADGYAMKKEGA